MDCPIHDSVLLDESHLLDDHYDAVEQYFQRNASSYEDYADEDEEPDFEGDWTLQDEVAGDLLNDVKILVERPPYENDSRERMLHLLSYGSES